jgi:hypothetical protein
MLEWEWVSEMKISEAAWVGHPAKPPSAAAIHAAKCRRGSALFLANNVGNAVIPTQ